MNASLIAGLPRSRTISSSPPLELASSQQLHEYRWLAADLLGIEFPLEYIDRGQVYVLPNRQGIVSGGALLVTRPPFRAFQGLPTLIRRQASNEFDLSRMAELNGVCLAKKMRGLHTSLLFWRSLLANALHTERTEFLFSFPLNGGQLPAIYREAKPKIIYAGPTRQLPGMEGPGEEITAVMSAEGVGNLLDMLDRWCD